MLIKNMDIKSYKERSKLVKTFILWAVVLLGFLAILFLQTTTTKGIFNSFGFLPQVQVQAGTLVDVGEPGTPQNIGSGRPIDLCDQGLGVGCVTGTESVASGGEGVIFAVMRVVFFLIFISSGIAILFIVLGAYKMITSNGVEESYKAGLNTLKFAVIGVCLAILSMSIIYIVVNITLGLDIFG